MGPNEGEGGGETKGKVRLRDFFLLLKTRKTLCDDKKHRITMMTRRENERMRESTSASASAREREEGGE